MNRVADFDQSVRDKIAEFYLDATTFERKTELDAEFVVSGLLWFSNRQKFAPVYEQLPEPFNHFTEDHSYDGKWWFRVEDDDGAEANQVEGEVGEENKEDEEDQEDHRKPMLIAINAEQPDLVYSVPIQIWGANPWDFFCRMRINQIKQVIVFIDYFGISVYNFNLEPIFRLANSVEMNAINCIWGAELKDGNQLIVWKIYDQEFSEEMPKYSYDDSTHVAPNDRIVHQLNI